MKTFQLQRHEDISGVSGTGIVAEGVQFHDGQCAVSWFSSYHTVEIAPNIDTVMAIHGHHGKTVLVWTDKCLCQKTKPTTENKPTF